jgi:phospholipid/cholesterol/gamma-HCH transport system permease protein
MKFVAVQPVVGITHSMPANNPPGKLSRPVSLSALTIGRTVSEADMSDPTFEEAVVKIEVRDGVRQLSFLGNWGIHNLKSIAHQISAVPSLSSHEAVALDLSGINHLDLSGAMMLRDLESKFVDEGHQVDWQGISAHYLPLLERSGPSVPAAVRPRTAGIAGAIDFIADSLRATFRNVLELTSLLGEVLIWLAYWVFNPSRIRFTSITHHCFQIGVGVIPVVMLTSLLVGAILSQQAAFQLRKFGAEILAVDLVSILVLRELALIVSAILVAGRSGSAITAQIGSMKMQEEIDALRVIGSNTTEILVLPRVVAMVLVLPAITLLSGLTAMFGAMMVSMIYSDLSPTAFLVRLSGSVDLFTFVWGVWKAPAVGLFIALIACNDGMKVEGSAESLGRRVTLSVVKSIFLVFALDSLFVLLFAALQG